MYINSTHRVINTTVPFSSTAVSSGVKDSKTKRTERLCYALGALAVVALGGLIYKNKSSKANLELIKTSTFQDLNSSLSKEEMSKLEEEFQKLENSKLELLNRLKNTHQSDIFKRYYALSKISQERPIQNPKLVVSDGSNSDIEKIGRFFSDELHCELKEVKYENMNPDEFLNLLDKLSTEASENYKTNGRNSCLKILNFEKFIEDLNGNFDKNQQKRFCKLLADNQKNHIIYVGKETPKTVFHEYDKMFLSFKEYS